MRYRLLSIAAVATVALLFPLVTSAPAARADVISDYQQGRVMKDALKGKLTVVGFPSAALKKTRDLFVYTPPGYSEHAPVGYPVIVLFHGSPGKPLDFLYKGEVHKKLDAAITAGKLPPTILVIPDGSGPYYKGGSEWADSFDGKCLMETAMTRDLPAFLKAHYRVSDDPKDWTLGGVSEGGYGAANLVVRHPDQFHNAIVLSGDFRVDEDFSDAADVFGKDQENWIRNSPLDELQKLSPQTRASLHFYVAVGNDDDDDVIAESQAFTAMCKSFGAGIHLDHEPGNHKWPFWGSHFEAALPLLARWQHGGK